MRKKISIEKRANRQASEAARKEKNKYFSESGAILVFPAFCRATCVAEATRRKHQNNPLGVLYVLWFGGKNKPQS